MAKHRIEARRPTAIVIGGGLAGLPSALLLANDGYRVIVLERDRRSVTDDPETAFQSWRRPGVPQFRHSHTFLARCTALLRERFPEVLDLLRRHGALELPLTVATPPGLDLGPRERGDGELVLLGCRRAAFEWALHRVASAHPHIEIRDGVLAEGLDVAAETTPQVRGVHYRAMPEADSPGEAIPWFASAGRERVTGPRHTEFSDVVVDASGRRGLGSSWLARGGAAELPEQTVPTGIFYFTRFYRLLGRRPPGATTGLVGGDLGWIKLATFPGDGDTFSVTVGTSIDDAPFRALSDPRVFEAMIARFPQVSVWREAAVSEPIDGPETPVLVMGGLTNRLRRLVSREGHARVTGYYPVGDAVIHTNPIYGRGATCALLSAVALADALAAHPLSPSSALTDYASTLRREIEPFWEAAAAGDHASAERARAARAGGPAPTSPSAWIDSAWTTLVDPVGTAGWIAGQATGAIFERGFAPASRKDGQVYRALMRVMNMLEPPSDLLSPTILARVMPFLVESLRYGRVRAPFEGPSRAEALDIIRELRPGAPADGGGGSSALAARSGNL